jgi:hypothetical protein
MQCMVRMEEGQSADSGKNCPHFHAFRAAGIAMPLRLACQGFVSSDYLMSSHSHSLAAE